MFWHTLKLLTLADVWHARAYHRTAGNMFQTHIHRLLRVLSLSLSFSSSLSFFRQGCSGCQAVVTDTKAWTCPKKNSYSMALMELGKCLGVLTSEFEVIGITSQECTTSCLT